MSDENWSVSLPREPRVPSEKSPSLEKLSPLLDQIGTQILRQETSRTVMHSAEEDSLGAHALKRELVAFAYACLGLVLVSQQGRSALGRAVRDELKPAFDRPRSPSAAQDGLARALLLASRGAPTLSLPPQGGLFDRSLFKRLLALDTGRITVSADLAAELLAWLLELADERAGAPYLLFGRMYEALLELEPQITSQKQGLCFRLGTEMREHSRRRLGSYYTPGPLIDEILDRALAPLIEEAHTPEELLNLRVIDPACGAGDFLHGATSRLASALARLEHGNGTVAGPEHFGRVLERCIFGIDIDPIAQELCRLGLWLEISDSRAALTPGSLPIRRGNAIVIPPNSERAPAKKGAPAIAYFDWNAEFPEVMRRGGFDAILGNPPWIAHAGRAAQSLPQELKAHLKRNAESFSGYPTTHGVFAGTLPKMLRNGGRLGLVLPTSVSELDGYAATRRAHDRYNAFPEELIDFGEGKFPGVTQPCMALVSERVEHGRGDDAGRPWPVARPELGLDDLRLLEKMRSFDVLPAGLFGERGLQSDRALLVHLEKSPSPTGRFVIPLREGTDVREFQLLPPRLHADPVGIGARLRSPEEFQFVRFVVRQTARFPIAALSDGAAFRNSLLAGFELPEYPAQALVSLLNSSLIRWAHFQRFRDARQPILPQVKIGHLRLLPAPPRPLISVAQDLEALGTRAASGSEDRMAIRASLDAIVFELYGLTDPERSLVERWRGAVTR